MSALPDRTDGCASPRPGMRDLTAPRASLLLLRTWWYTVPLVLVALASFGFSCTHYSISIDDLAGSRYIAGELLAQRRFTWPLIAHLFGFDNTVPLVMDALGIVLLTFSTALLSGLFVSVSRGRFTRGAALAFSCVYVSFPLSEELFVYTAMPLAVGGCMVLVALSLTLVDRSFSRRGARSFACLAGAVACLVLVVGWYESHIVVFICAVFALLFLANDPSLELRRQFGRAVGSGFRYAVVLAAGVVLGVGIGVLVMNVAGIEASSNAYNALSIVNGQNLVQTMRDFLFAYAGRAPFYLPIAVLDLSVLACLVLIVADAGRHRSPCRALLLVCMVPCLVVMTLLESLPAPYRTAQIVPFFVAAVAALVWAHVEGVGRGEPGRAGRALFGAALCVLVCVQVADINHWYRVDWERNLAERQIMHEIAADLDERGLAGKPVAFTGDFILGGTWREDEFIRSDDPRAACFADRGLTQVDMTAEFAFSVQETYEYTTWAMQAFGGQDELFKYLDVMGCPLIQATPGQLEDARSQAEGIPAWPAPSGIVDRGTYVQVQLGYTDPRWKAL